MTIFPPEGCQTRFEIVIGTHDRPKGGRESSTNYLKLSPERREPKGDNEDNCVLQIKLSQGDDYRPCPDDIERTDHEGGS